MSKNVLKTCVVPTKTVGQLRESSVKNFPEITNPSPYALYLNGKELEDNKPISAYPEIATNQVKKKNREEKKISRLKLNFGWCIYLFAESGPSNFKQKT